MLVDNRNKALNTYEYSLIQFHNMWTKEVLNIGVILNNADSFHFHIPRQYDKISTCLDFTQLSGLKYTLDIIEDRINNQQRVTYGEVSNSIFITEQKSFKSESAAKEALFEVIEQFMMIKKFREIETVTKVNKYDKMSILKLIADRAKEKDIKNFMKHKHFSIAKKQIDMALVNNKDIPYSIASVVSVYKDGFDDNIITSIFTLQEAMRSNVVKDQFLYVPMLKELSKSKENKSLGWAREQAHHIGVDFITDKRQDAVLERLNQYKPPKEELEEVEAL